MKNRDKLPSQLWAEAPSEARDCLSTIIKHAHEMWQKSDHYTRKSPIGRTPRAKILWRWHEKPELVEFRWVGEGINEDIIVEVSAENAVFCLLGNERFIRLLGIWLAVSDEKGFADSKFLQRADHLDFRRHLGPFENSPSMIEWAVIELYTLLFDHSPMLAETGFFSWGFWRSDEQGFTPLTEDMDHTSVFGTLDQFLDGTGTAADYKRILSLTGYDHSFAALATFSEEHGAELDWCSQDARFGSVMVYLLEQPSHSVEFLFGKTFQALKSLLVLDFETDLIRRDLQIIAKSNSERYRGNNLARDLISIGRYLSELRFRLEEERRALLARKFEARRKDRTKSATEGNRADRRRRTEAILRTVKTLQEEDFLTKSSGRVNYAALARAVAKSKPFRSTKSGMGVRAIARCLRELGEKISFRK